MFFINSVLAFIVVITVVVFFHELGHYIAARCCGIKILKFSIGMGPELCGFTDKRGVRWCISMIPIGGFLMMLGDADASSGLADEEVMNSLSPEEKKMAFHSKSNWVKILTSFSGPFANYLYAFITMVMIFTFVGIPSNAPVIDSVVEHGAAETAGLQAGDVIVSINNEKINKTIEALRLIQASDSVDITVMRGDNKEELEFKGIVPQEKESKSLFGKNKNVKQIGVGFGLAPSVYTPVTFFQAVKTSFNECVTVTVSMMKMLGKLFTGKQSMDSIGGFVYMASTAGNIANSGSVIALVMFTVLLSLNLGLINLLPLPITDGGNIFISFIEQIIGRPLNKKFMEYLMIGGFIFFLVIMAVTTVNDIFRLEAFSKLLGFLK